jgi:hypothetical protein
MVVVCQMKNPATLFCVRQVGDEQRSVYKSYRVESPINRVAF